MSDVKAQIEKFGQELLGLGASEDEVLEFVRDVTEVVEFLKPDQRSLDEVFDFERRRQGLIKELRASGVAEADVDAASLAFTVDELKRTIPNCGPEVGALATGVVEALEKPKS